MPSFPHSISGWRICSSLLRQGRLLEALETLDDCMRRWEDSAFCVDTRSPFPTRYDNFLTRLTGYMRVFRRLDERLLSGLLFTSGYHSDNSHTVSSPA